MFPPTSPHKIPHKKASVSSGKLTTNGLKIDDGGQEIFRSAFHNISIFDYCKLQTQRQGSCWSYVPFGKYLTSYSPSHIQLSENMKVWLVHGGIFRFMEVICTGDRGRCSRCYRNLIWILNIWIKSSNIWSLLKLCSLNNFWCACFMYEQNVTYYKSQYFPCPWIINCHSHWGPWPAPYDLSLSQMALFAPPKAGHEIFTCKILDWKLSIVPLFLIQCLQFITELILIRNCQCSRSPF